MQFFVLFILIISERVVQKKCKVEKKTQKFDCIINLWTFFFAQRTNRFECIALVKERTNKLFIVQGETLRL